MALRFARTLSIVLLGLASFASHATLVDVGGGGDLQAGLDAITEDGSFVDVNADQIAPDGAWRVTGPNVSAALLLFEFAAFESVNTFGIYDVTDPTQRLELFAGEACGGASVETTCTEKDSVSILQVVGTTFSNMLAGTQITLGTDAFGFYLDSGQQTGGGLFFSQAGLNSDIADAAHQETTDHMIAFAGTGVDSLNTNGGGYSPFNPGQFILAWEDLLFPNADYDYSDFVVMVNSIEPVPAPGTLALFGAGLLALGLRRPRHARPTSTAQGHRPASVRRADSTTLTPR